MSKPLRLLLIEDSQDDAALVVHELRRSGFDPDWLRVETAPALSAALALRPWDVIIADHNLPAFDAPAALALVRQAGLDVPFLIVSGSIGEELAVRLMKQGAADYLFKDRLARLGGAVQHALEEQRLREEKRQADQRLQDSARRLRAIFEHSSDGLSLLDASGTVVFASPSVTPILGYALHEFVGRNAFELVHPDDLPDLRDRFARLLGQPGGTQTAQVRSLHRDGSWRWVEAVASNFLADPNVQAVVCNYRDITERKAAERQAHELQLAGEVQQHLLPAAMPVLAGFDIAGVSYPAEATGGDFFDFLPLGDAGLGMVIADVAGHGFPAALLMAEAHAYLRALLLTYRHAGRRSTDDIGQMVGLLNRALASGPARDRFVTLLFARLQPRTREFVYLNAGHPAGYVLDPSGAVKRTLESTGPPLGVTLDVSFPAGGVLTLEPGDLVLFLTDGVLDAKDPDNKVFGRQRALAAARASRHHTARGVADELYHAVRAFARGLPQLDDITSVVIKVGGTP